MGVVVPDLQPAYFSYKLYP